MKIRKNKLLMGVIICVIALLITFVLGPISEIFTSRNVQVVRIKNYIAKGAVINDTDLELVEVGKYNLPDDIITDKTIAVGQYAAFDLQGGDYMTVSKTSKDVPFADAYLTKLADGKQAISVELSSSAAALSGKLRTDDIISIFAMPPTINETSSDGQPIEEQYAKAALASKALSFGALQYVKILAVVSDTEKDIAKDESSISLETAVQTENNPQQTGKQSIQTVILEVNSEQAALLAGLNAANKLHFSLVVRGNNEKAAELLKWQESYFTQQAPPAEEVIEVPKIPTEENNTEGDDNNA